MSGGGYLVAQVGDTVRIDARGPLYGTFGMVEAERTAIYDADGNTTVTARECDVRSDGGALVTVHADRLTVLPPLRSHTGQWSTDDG